VKLFDLGGLFLGRYRAIFDQHYAEDRDLTVKQAVRGYLLGLLGLFAFYGCYAWIALRTARGELSFGELPTLLLVFRNAQHGAGAALDRLGVEYEDLR